MDVNLTVFSSNYIIIFIIGDKNISHCRVLEGGRLTIPKEVREKLSRKDEDFVDFYLQDMVQIK